MQITFPHLIWDSDVFETFNVMKSFARVLPVLSWSLSSLTGLVSLWMLRPQRWTMGASLPARSCGAAGHPVISSGVEKPL